MNWATKYANHVAIVEMFCKHARICDKWAFYILENEARIKFQEALVSYKLLFVSQGITNM